jgi:hypothetical protein
MSKIDNLHRISRLLAAVCVALTISAPFAVAYVETGKSGPQTEQTGHQVDRANKSDRFHVAPQQKPVERDGSKKIEAPRTAAPPRMLA